MIDADTPEWRPHTVDSADDIPDHFPDDIDPDNGPFCWVRESDSASVQIDYCPDIDPENPWMFGGNGSIVFSEPTLTAVQLHAVEYLRENDPGPMVIG